VAVDGFLIKVLPPAPKVVGAASLALLDEGDRFALYEAMRRDRELA
jgi:hypothetical protein